MAMKPVEWEEVNQLFGPLVEADLKASNVILKKTITGGLVVPKKYGFILDECRHLYRNKNAKKLIKKNDKLNEQKLVNIKPENYDLDDEDNCDLFVNFRRTLDWSSNNLESSSSISKNLQSNTSESSLNSGSEKKNQYDQSNKIPEYIKLCNYRRFDDSHIFSRDLSTVDKVCEFIESDLKKYESCVQLIEPIFAKFLRKHRRFQYKFILKNIPQEKSLFAGQLSLQQLQGYFRRIFWEVVPVKLFGNQRNTRKIRKKVNKYFTAAFGEYFSVQTVIKTLNISAVEWLRGIKNENTKISIMSQLVESFFEKYIMAVLGTYFYTEKVTYSNEKLFFHLDHWLYYTNKYITYQMANGVYKAVTFNVNEEETHNIPRAKLTLHVKKNGFRPILLSKPTPAQKREAFILNKILYQICLSKFRPVTLAVLENVWRNVHKTFSNKEDRSPYFVKCDIHDAFGSINQQKLLDILMTLIDELDEKLILQTFAIFDPRIATDSYRYHEYFDCPSLSLTLPKKTLSCRDTSKRSKIIEKEWVKSRLKSYILHRQILINNKLYYQKKGIGQGVPLTSLLCEIYYGNMLLENFGAFIERGHLLRYVDDFLFFTDDRTTAERFLEQVHTGIENYDCTFNATKTSTNLPPYCAEEFVYLGYHFNIKTFDVMPKYPDVPVRYAINLKKPEPIKILPALQQRLKNCQFLKIQKFVLDPSINSKQSIEKTVHQIILMSAKRCFAFLTTLLNCKDISGIRIFTVIQKCSVNPLCRKLSKLCSATNIPSEDIKSIKKSVWRAYYRVFRSDIDLIEKLGPRIRSKLK